MRLTEVASGRDNNFNLIRIFAALAVLVSHSYPLSLGGNAAQPLSSSLGITLGDVAVDIFFFTSGFLVTASLLARRSVGEFLRARVLRIYPALWVMLVLVVCCLGPALSTLPASRYWSDTQTLEYLVRDALLFTGIRYPLPGLFAANPYPNAVNGSLWTLLYEVRLYIALALAWAALRWMAADSRSLFRRAAVAVAVLSCAAQLLLQWRGIHGWASIRLSSFFFCGAAFQVLRERVVLRPAWLALTLGLLGGAALWGHRPFAVAYELLLGWLVLHLAYLPSGTIRRFNALGDYSYGVYIYAFPVQQTLAYLLPRIGVASMMLASAAVTLAFAACSWHWVERPALALKRSRG